ncbi:MAG: hypothetical protein DMG14_11095 [Acidobacteria bacterium]|nr:MAG: hypothetical protein DMG14_11095 [Acidobacteriota bacterium]
MTSVVILPPKTTAVLNGIVRRRQRLGGMLNYYLSRSRMASVYGPYGVTVIRINSRNRFLRNDVDAT